MTIVTQILNTELFHYVIPQDDNVVITWFEEPGHVTSIPLLHLMENNYSRESRQRYRERVTPPRQQVHCRMGTYMCKGWGEEGRGRRDGNGRTGGLRRG